MAFIKFQRLSMSDAEDVMAKVWNCLEEYDITSPRMTCQRDGHAHVTLRFRFDESVWADVVALQLSRRIVVDHYQSVAEVGGSPAYWPPQRRARTPARPRCQVPAGIAISFVPSPFSRAR